MAPRKVGLPFFVLADVRLHDPHPDPARFGAQSRARSNRSENQNRSLQPEEEAVAPNELQERARQRDREPAQSGRPDPARDLSNDRDVNPDDAQRIPGETCEQPAPRPFGQDPCGGKGEHPKGRAVAGHPLGKGQGQRRIKSEISCQNQNCCPASPTGKAGLVLKGLRQPMKA